MALIITHRILIGDLELTGNPFTKRAGQVSGLNGKAINKIFLQYGVAHKAGTESGRTSRGTILAASKYLNFLQDLDKKHKLSSADLKDIEHWWVQRFVEFFDASPFKLHYDTSKSFATVFQNLFDQAFQRQKKASGKTYAGAMLQHLVGATLELALPSVKVSHNGTSVADTVSARVGDFTIDNSVIHCTTAPTEALIQKCQANLQSARRPIVITIESKFSMVKGLAENISIDNRIEIIDCIQFLSLNLFQISLFNEGKRKTALLELIDKYNEIILTCESEPSLQISFD